MVKARKDIILCYPGTHSVEGTRKLVAAFKSANPKFYDE